MNDANQATANVTIDNERVFASQAVSAGLGVALAASIAGIALAPASLVALGAGALFCGAKRIAKDHSRALRNGL